jgi:hypothetical protein
MSDAIGINMPSDFPTLAHNDLSSRLGAYQREVLWPECAAGWNGVARRFFAAAKADSSFTASVRKSGTGPAFDERQVQEEALFVFFVAGLSAIESLAYALYAMGAMLQPGHFPMSTEKHFRAIEPKFMQQKFATSFAGTPVALAITALVGDAAYTRWCEIRNVLAHRLALPRHHKLSGGTSANVAGGLTIADRTTSDQRKWLASQLTACVQATEAFLPPSPT